MSNLQAIEKNVRLDQANSLEVSQKQSVLGTMLVSSIVAWLFRDAPHQHWVFCWLGLQLFYSGFRLWLRYREARVSDPVADADTRLRRATIAALISGLLWASAVLVLWSPDDFESNLMVIFIMAGAVTFALYSLGAYLPPFYCFLILCEGSVFAASLASGGRYYGVAAIIGCAGLLHLRQAKHLNRMIVDSLRRHYEIAELARALQQQKERAESANLSKSRFLAAASHDLRQPMHALSLYLGLLDHHDLPLAARPVLANLRGCAQTMEEMFCALLDVARLDSGAIKPDRELFPIAGLLEKIAREFTPQAQAKGLRLRVVQCASQVRTDAKMLEQIVRNLVSNAVRYTDRGTVLIGCRRIGTGLRIGVYDSGIGIAPDQQKLIFEEFYQIGNRSRDRAHGMGLGLAIVQRLASALEASLNLISDVGRGSCFMLDLAEASHLSAVREVQRPRGPPRDVGSRLLRPGTLDNALIAVIDDEPLIADAMRQLLRQWRCDVIVAESGEQALELLAAASRAPDAILCDYRLRGAKNGTDAVMALRDEFNSEIPALLITGDTAPDRLQAILAAGLPILFKPVSDQALRAALLQLVHPAAAS